MEEKEGLVLMLQSSVSFPLKMLINLASIVFWDILGHRGIHNREKAVMLYKNSGYGVVVFWAVGLKY